MKCQVTAQWNIPSSAGTGAALGAAAGAAAAGATHASAGAGAGARATHASAGARAYAGAGARLRYWTSITALAGRVGASIIHDLCMDDRLLRHFAEYKINMKMTSSSCSTAVFVAVVVVVVVIITTITTIIITITITVTYIIININILRTLLAQASLAQAILSVVFRSAVAGRFLPPFHAFFPLP